MVRAVPIFDHIGLTISNFDRSLAFFTQALAPLGYELVKQFPGAAGFGPAGKPDFWISARPGQPTSTGVHIAFAASGRAAVRAFYEAAVAAGGTDNGAPGLRPQYHEHYYGAFVHCPDGNNIEAVCHEAYLG